jgi:hypothetical protein
VPAASVSQNEQFWTVLYVSFGHTSTQMYGSAKLLRRLRAGRCGQSVDLMFPDCREWEFYERQLEDETPLGRVGS